jgi:hypothetical protein
MIGSYIFIVGFIVAVIYLVLTWLFLGTIKRKNPELWIRLGEPSIFKSSSDSNIKVLKYLFSSDQKPTLAHILKYLFILFIIIFIGYVFLFFYE